MSLKRFGVSLEDNLLESLDQYVNENGLSLIHIFYDGEYGQLRPDRYK